MAPILGIYASQISGHLWEPQGAYESIQTITVGAGGASSITFSSIPSTYKHLQIRAILRDTAAQSGSQDQIWFNGDTGNNYNWHQMYGNGSTVASQAGAGSTAAIYGVDRIPAANDTAGIYGAFIISITDYASTSKYKTLCSLSGYDANGSGLVKFSSGLYMSFNAINQISLTPQSGGSYVQYSHFALYGIN